MSRDPLDRYYTPDALALGCMRALLSGAHRPDVVLEPCSGGGAFGRAALSLGVSAALGCDIDPDAAPGYPCERVPAATWSPALPDGKRVWIVTNPHYVGVYETVAALRALQERTGAEVLALLLRETTIGQLMCGTDPPHALHVSAIRPRWGGAGGAGLSSGDTCGSVLSVWRRRAPGLETWGIPTTIHALPPWRPKGKAAAETPQPRLF